MNISNEERILKEFNNTTTEYPKSKNVSIVFEEQVIKNSHKTAVFYNSKSLSYNELNEKANQLARKLIEKGVSRGSFVGIFAQKSLEMIIGLFAIIKAGAAYVPIDPKYPEERINYIIKDCNPKLILTFGEKLNFIKRFFDISIYENYSNMPKDNLVITNSSEDLIYVIYTSGTTGKPKGVMIEHKNVLRLVKNTNFVNLDENTKILQTGSLSFDASTFEIYGSLLNGGQLTLVDSEELLDNVKFSSRLKEYEINTMFITNALFNQMISIDETIFDSLSNILVGGEILSEKYAKKLIDRNKARFIHVYGPTENTTFTTSYNYYDSSLKRKITPIGKPINNTKVYIINDGKLCDIGVSGELCIAGDGLARGYLNQDELTQKKFIDNPYDEGKLYCSGDLVKWLEDGNIEYIGRIDEQVKIHGFRIELGEIESVLKKNPLVVDCAVVVRENSSYDKILCAYFVSEVEVLIDNLKEDLSKELPEYMIPKYFMQVESLPITINGKIDKRNLPEIKIENDTFNYIVPRNKKELLLSNIFEQVLNLEKVSLDSSFFDLGGHSLKATLLINQIEENTGVRLKLNDIFKNQNIEKLSKLINIDNTLYEKIPKCSVKSSYPMSFAQKRMYLTWQMDTSSIAYNISYVFKIIGEVDIKKLKFCINKLIERHEILRTNFIFENEEFKQIVNESLEFEIFHEEDKDTPEQSILENFVQKFDLSKAPIFRVSLIDRGEHSLLLFDMHHIIGDGMSVGNFIKELSSIYNGNQLEQLTVQYKDYSEWIINKDFSAQKNYWEKIYLDEIEVLNMPLDFPRPKFQSFEGDRISYTFSNELIEKIKYLTQKTDTTQYMIFLSAVMILLGKYSYSEDVVIGSPISARTHKDTESMLGMFVNMLPMRARPERHKNYRDFLEEIKYFSLNSYENQDYPYENLIESLSLARDISRNPLFDVALVLQNNENISLNFNNINVQQIKFPNKTSKFDLTFEIEEKEGIYTLFLEYRTDLYTLNTATRLISSYIEILNQIVKSQDMLIRDIDLSSVQDKEKILKSFNRTESYYPEYKTIVDLFEEQVEKTPNNIAIVYEDKKLTYLELNEKSNSLAHLLRKKGVSKNSFVAILTERSIEMIIAIYAVIKSGGAYVPIDTDYPLDRINYIIDNCNTKIIITDIENIILNNIETINILDEAIYENYPKENPFHINTSNDLLYVIYTSGTTGKPKGVMIEHKNLVRLLFNNDFQFDFSEQDTWTMFHSYCFDFSVWEMYGATLRGGKLVVIPKYKIKDSELLLDELEKNKVTVLNQVPSSFYNLMHEKVNGYKYLKYLIFGGEALQPKKLYEWYKSNSHVKIVNMYGITETTVHATYQEIGDYEIKKGISSIGSAIPTLKIYILDGDNLCGIGIPGELCVSGEGLARGYLNLKELTNEKFIKNPYGEGKLYRSGDLARWLEDGNIEYLGRIDEQVKIRGFRIELGEIENTIRSYSGIKDSIVIVHEDIYGDKALYGYVVSSENIEINKLKEHLSKELPEHMIPSYLMQIEQIPITFNGKLDKKNLPQIKLRTENEYIAPRNEKEEALSITFKEILGSEIVGVKDSFFALGGDSIKALRIVSKMRERNYDLHVRDILNERTIESICEKVVVSKELKYEQGEVIGIVKPTPIIKTFESWNLEEPHHFNQSMMIKVNGNFKAVEKSIETIVRHHDMLRAVYSEKQLRIVKNDYKRYEYKVFDYANEDSEFITQEKIQMVCNDIQKSVDLKKGPLVKCAFFKTKKGHYLFICVHHLIIDGVSWRILIEDINTVLKQIEKNEEIKLPKKTASFIEWSEMLEDYKNSKNLKKESNYWSKIESEISEIDYKLQSTGYKKFYDLISFELSEEETSNLLKDSSKAYNTEINDLLLSSLSMVMRCLYENKDKMVVLLEGHGREQLHNDIKIDRTVGWFTTIYPIILNRYETIEDSIISTKEMLRKIPNNGIGYSLISKFNKEIDISFNYLGEIEESSEKYNYYKIGNEISEKNILPQGIMLDGVIKDKKLKFEIRYDKSKYLFDKISMFFEEYKKMLQDIIFHCCTKNMTTITISDVSDEMIDNQEFDEISNSLKMLL
ncbi:MAG: amino acid adenylation domain-containing protein [Defluviitaleaceae bacterium]|nr:amino acid adenylation domain-containing protein [Defluviitaleaceae bacterium]